MVAGKPPAQLSPLPPLMLASVEKYSFYGMLLLRENATNSKYRIVAMILLRFSPDVRGRTSDPSET